MEFFSLENVIEFSDEKRIRKKLIQSDGVIAEIVCYEPGQGTVTHHHPRQDEVFHVVEGQGTITIGEDSMPVSGGHLIFAPRNVPHSLAAAEDSRLVILFFKGPGTLPRPNRSAP